MRKPNKLSDEQIIKEFKARDELRMDLEELVEKYLPLLGVVRITEEVHMAEVKLITFLALKLVKKRKEVEKDQTERTE